MVTIIAKSKFVKISPRKVRIVATMVKKLPLNQALSQLELLPKRSGRPLLSTLKQAVANASHNLHLSAQSLTINNILVDEGSRRSSLDKSHGSRWDRGIIHKRTSHITVLLESKDQPAKK